MARFIEADVIQKIATEAEWLTQTRIPYQGQIMIVSDSSGKVTNIKVGDGVNPYSDLSYMFDSIQQNAQYVPITSNALPTPVADPAWGMVTGGTYTFGGVDVFTVPDAHWGIANYSSGGWSLVDMGELPQVENKILDWEAGTYVQGDQRIHNGQIWRVDVASTTEEPGTGTDWVGDIDKVTPDEIGIISVSPSTNILQAIADSDIEDDSIWVDGYYSATGSLLPSVAYRSTRNVIPAYPGVYNSLIYYSGNARVLAFDGNGVLIEAIPNPSSDPITYGHEITLPEGTASIKISHLISTDVWRITATPKTELTIPTNEVFATPPYVAEKSKEIAEETLSKFGFEPIPLFTNFIEELTTSSLSDTSIWGNGMLRDDGNIFQSPEWYHTKKKYRVYAGTYKLINYFRVNGKVLLFNESEEIVQSITGGGSPTVPFNGDIEILQDGYIQLSFGSDESRLVDVGLWNNELIYPKDSTSTASVVAGSNESMPVNGKAVTLFQRDIFKNIHIPKSKIAVASFISDDGKILGNEDWYTPLLEAKGVRGTFAIITGQPDINETSLSWARLREMEELGHEIAGHTQDHLRLGDISLAEAEYQISRCKTELLAHGFYSDTFVAPYSSRNDDVSRIIRKYFKTDWKAATPGMILDGTCCNTPPIESFLLKRIAFDAQTNGVSTLADAKAAVDVAFEKNEWVAFAIHPQYPEYNPTFNPDGYLSRRQDVSDLIDYILSKNIQILTVKQALEIWRNPVEIGNIRLDNKYYALGMDGTEDGNYFD